MAEQWSEFSIVLKLKDFPEDQRREMRRAFYAGAQAILFKIIQVLAPEAEPTEDDLQMMSDLHQELQDFAKLISQGRA